MRPVRISVEIWAGLSSERMSDMRSANDNPSRDQELFELSIRRELVDDTV